MGTLSAIAALAAAYVALLGARVRLAGRVLRRQRRDAGKARFAIAEVAVLQPILSGDPRLAGVLEDALRALPDARFHWLVDADDAEARRIVEELRRRHPGARACEHVNPPPPDGANPKTFKLDRALARLQEPVCLVLDDDARLSAPALSVLLAALDSSDLATALPQHRDAERLPGRLLAQFVNDNAALTYLAPLAFAPPLSINGMCYAMRTARLREIGGFAPLLPALADDLALADRLRRHGGTIAQTAAAVEVQTSIVGLAHYVRQMHRWMLFATLLLRRQPPRWKFAILVLQGLPPALLWALLLAVALRPSGAAFGLLALTLAARAGLLAAARRGACVAARPHPLLSLLSELLQPLHLLHATIVRTVRWRSRRYRVHDDGRFDAA